MRLRWILAVLSGCLLVLSGCIGGLEEQASPATPEALDEAEHREVELSVEPGSAPEDRSQASDTLEVPEQATGLFLTFELAVEDSGDAETWLSTPDGERVDLATVDAMEPTEVEDHILLAPEAGTWSLTIDASAPSSIVTELTIQTTSPSLSTQRPQGDTRPIVAAIDTGINPYHEVFAQPLATSDLPERVLEDGEEAPLSVPIEPADTYEGSLAGDAPVWAQVPDERLVHFQGTNVLGYQLGDTELPQAPVLDAAGHGTSVAHAITREAPDALVVMVSAPDYDAGVQWAAEQPWIDVISLSWGPAANVAGAAEPYATGFQTPEVTRAAHDAGKLVVAASGNDPTLTVTDTTTGPPWVHAVSGAQPDTQGRAAQSGNLVDTVANWTQTLAQYEHRNETSQASGTSFATPTTAGIGAHVLGEVRSATGHEGGIADGALVATEDLTVTNSQLRTALNRSAVYWDTADYGGPSDPGPSIPIAPAPWVSMGWGYLDGSRAEVAIEGLTTGEWPDRPAEAEAWMEQHQQSREAYWQAR